MEPVSQILSNLALFANVLLEANQNGISLGLTNEQKELLNVSK